MAKKSKAVSMAPVRLPPMIYLTSQDRIKIPKSVKGKLGKTVNLSVKAKVVSQRLSRDAGRRPSESYDLEIQKIRSSRRKK